MRSKVRKHRRKEVPRPRAFTLASLQENAILRFLNGAESARVVELGEFVEMPTRHVVYNAESEIRDVYFPTDSILSIVTQMDNGEAIEIGTIGREGTSALPLLMGATTTANSCYCQVPGGAVRLSAEEFHRLMTDKKFRVVLDRYMQAYMNFLGQLTACNRLHSVYERTARWLLLSHDRVGEDAISLTHEYLAMMLGSRRSGVSIALAALQRAGFIRYAHGQITILDRPGLEDTTCECYRVAQRQFAGLLRAAKSTKTAKTAR